jgi:EAL domain-containing protein (putative c-di-GMP-specific phosphodiesterase class I)/putative methionine-R-sulfoxide reductase with GAF domain
VTITGTGLSRLSIDKVRAAVERLCEPGVITSVVQPIVRPADMVVVGYEALARMPLEPYNPPDWWLEVADEFGLRHELERACLIAAAALGPPPDGRVLFVNASPSTIADPMALALRDQLPDRLVLELTEQEAVDDYGDLERRLAGWMGSGVRLAVDDAGAGYSSLRHVVELSPDYLKLDRNLVRKIDEDPNRRALMRAVVAFAREVGTSVIAEGVETRNELEVLREAEVHLVQGYLLARPGPPWPTIGHTGSSAGTRSETTTDGDASDDFHALDAGDSGGASVHEREDRLREALAPATNVLVACDIAVEAVFRQGQVMASLYLERNRELRCVAQRGLWQVLDGMPATVGITGRTWATGKATMVDDVSTHPDYREAVPGVVSELCVPIVVNDETIGALDVESLFPLSASTIAWTGTVARVLGDRLGVIGINLGNTRWQRAAQASVAMSGLVANRRLPEQVLHRFRDAADMDSASLVIDGPDGPRSTTAVGPLASNLLRLTADELIALSSLVGDIRSCYTAGDASSAGFVGTESLRAAGARAVVVLPLWSQRKRLGTVVLAHSRPLRLTGDRVEPIELLADHVAAVLGSVLPPDASASGNALRGMPSDGVFAQR